jgi:N-acetylmuramoyl-L-alanine amidase
LRREEKEMATIRRIVLHCSDSPDTNTKVDVNEIRRWHVKERGWSDIGYHFVVKRDGTVQQGRYHNGDSILEGKEIGAHARGHNSDSLAVCWVGRDKPAAEQYDALLELLLSLAKAYRVPLPSVLGHCELDPGKTCPNLDMGRVRSDMRRLETLRQKNKPSA